MERLPLHCCVRCRQARLPLRREFSGFTVNLVVFAATAFAASLMLKRGNCREG